jgi:hypothetical protein
VVNAVAGLGGYSAGFHRSDDDHELGLLEVQLDTLIQNNVVIVTATYGLRDWSGEWDDEYEGLIDIVVLAELEDPSLPPARADLAIMGMEINQATQAFRSNLHLDAANVRPDNSIPLVARKATGLRIYVDYDDTAGGPPIMDLSGELEVLSSMGGTILKLDPQATIAPRRDSQIDRGEASHTLNFIVPEAWCQGDLTIRARVFEAGNPTSTSPLFQRSIHFREVEPLRLVAVMVRYTGQGMNNTPTQQDILGSLTFTEATYPIPEIFITSVLNLTFSEDFSRSGSGCGSAFSDLLDELEDLVGDADDLIFGFLPAGINYGPAVGCGRAGVGTGAVDRDTTVAHELGHALGRKHAPAGCTNADEDFPQYGSFASGSIGEFGYDTRNNSVHDPALTFDFMCGRPRWVSPYTYNALADRFPPVEFSAFASSLSLLRAAHTRSQTLPVEVRPPQLQERLFLGLTIARDRRVTLRHSFHYPAPSPRVTGIRTPFTVTCLDQYGEVLSCDPLHETCVQCDPECWPKTIRTPILFPEGTRRLQVWEGRDDLYQVEIPDPPSIKVRSRYDEERQEVHVEWEVVSRDKEDLWFLVQWQDAGERWRGLAPRTRARDEVVPNHLFGHRTRLRVRVLATSGIATTVETIEVVRPREGVQPPRIDLFEMVPPALARVSHIEVKALRTDGLSVPDPEIVWFNQEGDEIGRGKRVFLSALGEGQHLVRAVLRDTGFGTAERTWLVEIDAHGNVRGRAEGTTNGGPRAL